MTIRRESFLCCLNGMCSSLLRRFVGEGGQPAMKPIVEF
ncbi:hypothetical protein RDI58_006192 [Solanum bulbocastanum]|uniref:Uncharacterized protein n=1 Tax=Solanum bulbocastanum TaxID=147425 RepID=A0AAN8YLN0_SOLBU